MKTEILEELAQQAFVIKDIEQIGENIMALNEEYIRKIEFLQNNLTKRMYSVLGGVEFRAFFTYDRLTLDEAKLHTAESIQSGTRWGKKWQYGWFFAEVDVPKNNKKVLFMADLGECIVFVNDEVKGALDKEHTAIDLSDYKGQTVKIALEVYAGHDNGAEQPLTKTVLPGDVLDFPDDICQKTVTDGTYGIFHSEVFGFWMDINTLYDLRNNMDKNSLRLAKIDKALEKACNIIDIELPDDEFFESVLSAREVLKPVFACKNSETTPTIYAIGHSHLDLQWLWTKEETRRKIARTVGNQMQLIKKYDEYKYIQTQPWLLDVLKKEYPKLYSDVKAAVKEGKIIVEGGMWVEADVNIPSGESLIRQFAYGKKFIKDEFGIDSEMLWLPDVFGLTAALPQIMKGCGIKYFMNAKITWQYNGGDPFPHTNFIWRGIDGSGILSHVTQEYAVEMTPSKVFEKWNMNKEKADVPAHMLPFGHGDGGGGATEIHLEYLEREKDLEGMPKVICEAPNKFFELVENECEVNKEYTGELYYTAHRGSYTSQANTKKNNRKCEMALREAELWSALCGNDTNKTELDGLWKKVLFNQFHDIIPGTAITKVYEIADKDYEFVLSGAEKMLKGAIGGEKTDSEYITVYNSLSWDRNALIELPSGCGRIFDLDGKEIRTQKIGNKVCAIVSLPSVGYKSFRVEKGFNVDALHTSNEICLENELVKAVFNENGEVISFKDKKTGGEYLSEPSNVFRMYRDAPTFFDAWDIDSFYEKEEVPIGSDVEICVENKGGLISTLKITRNIGKSNLTQRVSLRADSRQIDFETEIDWQETHKLLKVDMNTNIHTDGLISEIQFGHIKRPNHKNRNYDADRFEVCQHKWSALSESGRCAAILNDCKYGISAYGGRMSLTLLKSAAAPDPHADKGMHKLTYSLLISDKGICQSEVVRRAYELNCLTFTASGNKGEKSFVRIASPAVILETIKLAEDESGDIIVRLYESTGGLKQTKIQFGFDIKEAYITNMIEENTGKIDVKNNEISLELKAFEVKTIRIKTR